MNALVLLFIRSDDGQDLIEYVLIGSLVSVVVIAGATALGTQLNGWFQNMADWVGDHAIR
jgi:Flp pilus assembly pilin Flp